MRYDDCRGKKGDARERPSAEATLTVTEAAKQLLQVTRQTLYAWIRTGKVLAWRTSKPGYHIPAEQILGLEQFVPDIDRVLAVIPEPRTAWRFLTEESPYFEEPVRPIDTLKAGVTERVVEAARLHGEATT
jgi:excisionase family DNA binding protein